MKIEPCYIDENYNIREYVRYADDVIAGKTLAPKYVILACKRFKQWFTRKDIYFDMADVDMRIKFIWKLRHNTGQHYGKHFRLLPWQQFAVANIFGWKHKDTGFRVTRNCMIFIARKAGKTAFAAALTLATLIGDREHSGEADFVANNTKQAAIAFKHTKDFAESIDPKGRLFKRYRSEIRIPELKSNIQVLSSDASGLDGLSASIAICDEIHAYRDWDLYNVMKSSQGARQQPLLVTLTTSGFLVGSIYPCYSMWQTCKEILDGVKKDDTQFSLLYTLDEGDDWRDEKVWIKANPSLGETVSLEYLRNQVNDAINNTAMEVGVKTKNLNMWVNSAETWLTHDLVVGSMQKFNLSDFKDKITSFAYGAVDLASVSDLTAFCVMLECEGRYYFKLYYFLPQDTINNSVNSPIYKEMQRRGFLIATAGNVTDYDYVLAKIMECDKEIQIHTIYFDEWNSASFVIDAQEKGLRMMPWSQKLGSFNLCTKTFERLIKSGKVVLDKNPLTAWCFDNATLKFDSNENCKPIKTNPQLKIDGCIAILQALGGSMYENRITPNLEVL